jgi:putative transposase
LLPGLITTESLALQGGDGFNSFPGSCFLRGSIVSGGEGLLTISTGVRVSPKPEAIELLRRYNAAHNYAINKILSLGLRSFGRVHNALYRELREWFGLPSRVAIDCYRDALANAKSWRNNPRRGRRPRVRRLSMLLHQGTGCRAKDGYVEIIGGIRMEIIG